MLGVILLVAIRLYTLVLVGRIIIEMIQSFGRTFQPPRWFIMIAEVLFVLTDPPVKALRRVIPPLRTGGVAVDMSVLVLFLLLMVVSMLVRALLLSST